MPPTAFAAVLDGLPLAADERRAIDELLALKSRAGEKDRIVIDIRLERLMRDRFDEVAEVRWRKVLTPMEETRNTLEAIFRRHVKT